MSLLSKASTRSSAALNLSYRSTNRISTFSLSHTSNSPDQSIAFSRVYSTYPDRSRWSEHLSSSSASFSSTSPSFLESQALPALTHARKLRHEASAAFQDSRTPFSPSSAASSPTSSSSYLTFSSPSSLSSLTQRSSVLSSRSFATSLPTSVSRAQSYQGHAGSLYYQYVNGKLAPINKAKPIKKEILPPIVLEDRDARQVDGEERKDRGGTGRVKSRFIRDMNVPETNGDVLGSVTEKSADRINTEVELQPQQISTSKDISLARGFERTLEGDQNTMDGKMQFYKEPVEKSGVLLFESDARKITQPEILDMKKIPTYPTNSQLAALESAADEHSRPTFLSDPLYFSTLCALVYNSISTRPDLSDKNPSNFQNYRPMSFNLLQRDDSNVYHIAEDVDLSVQPLKHFKNIDTIISKMMTTPTEQMESLIKNADFVDDVEHTRNERAKAVELPDIYLGPSRLYSSSNLPGNGEFSVKTKVTNRIMHDCMPAEDEKVKKFEEQMDLFQIERESSNLRDMVQDWFALRLEERQGLLTVFHNTTQLQGFEYRSIDFIQDALLSSSKSYSSSSTVDRSAANEAVAESRFRETIIAVTEILQRISVDFKYHSDLNVIINQREQNPLAIYVFSHGLSKESSASGKRAGKMLLGSYVYEYRNAPGSEAWSPQTTVTTRDIIAAKDEIAIEMQDVGEALKRPANPLFLLSIYDPTDLLNLFDRRRDLAPGWRNPSHSDDINTSYRSSDGAGKGREIEEYTVLRNGVNPPRQPPPSFLDERADESSTRPGLSFDLGIYAPTSQFRPWKEVLNSPPTASGDAPVLANGLYATDHSALFEVARKSKAWTSEMEPVDRNLVGKPNLQDNHITRWNKLQAKMKSFIESEFPTSAPSAPSTPSTSTVTSAPSALPSLSASTIPSPMAKKNKSKKDNDPLASHYVLPYTAARDEKITNQLHFRDSDKNFKPTAVTLSSNASTPNSAAFTSQESTYRPKVDSQKALAAWQSAEQARRRVVDFFEKEKAINPDSNYEVDLKTGHGLLNKPVRHKLLANFIKINPNASSFTQNLSSSSTSASSPTNSNLESSAAAAAAISAAVAVARKSYGNILHNTDRSQQRYRRSFKKPKK